MNIGKNIRRIRIAKGKSQTFVASKCGKTPGWLNNIEHGRRQLTVNDARKLAEALEIPLEEIFFQQELNETFNNGSKPTGTTG